jgi:TatD DNase family protein
LGDVLVKESVRIVDTHCHLDSEEFLNDLPKVIERAMASRVHMISSATSQAGWLGCLRISAGYPSVDAAIGLDPATYSDRELAVACIRSNSSRIVAVGETGLDYYFVRDHEQRAAQEEAFVAMIRLALELALPVQVHSRSAGKRALEILTKTGAERVHMHAFDGKASLAREASRELGYYFSIPTSVVRSPQKRNLVRAVDYERLLVETDSPVLGPDPTARNEPANVWIALREVAALLGRGEDEVRSIVLENTLRLYNRIRIQ